MTRLPLLVLVPLFAMRCGEPPSPTPSPTAPPVSPTPTETETEDTPVPTPTEPPPTQRLECPTYAPIPYCDLHPEDC